MKVAISGANGYIGKPLCNFLLDAGYHVVALVRDLNDELPGELTQIVLNDLSSLTLSKAEKIFKQIKGFDAFIHLAAMAHNDNRETHYLEQVYKVNVRATEVLSRAAAEADKSASYPTSAQVADAEVIAIPEDLVTLVE